MFALVIFALLVCFFAAYWLGRRDRGRALEIERDRHRANVRHVGRN
jgi:Mg2+/citrate symporter